MSKLSATFRAVAERPVVVARRWDGLGGRLNAVINAWALSSALGAEFRFAWPGGDGGTGAASELFAESFLAAHLVDDSEFESCETLPDPTESTLEKAREDLRRAGGHSLVDVTEYVAALGFTDESHQAASARFRASALQIGWNPAVTRLIPSLSGQPLVRGYAAIHVRAGDIVNGGWRQFLPVEKYTPRAHIEVAIERLIAEGAEHVVIVSDNAEYGAWLRERCDRVRSPQELIEGYGALTPSQRAFADIWLLSQGTRILGPAISAFSRLAGNLAGRPVLGTHELLSGACAQNELARAIDRDLADTALPAFQQRLLVRDIVWYLDAFGDGIDLGERKRLSEAAVALEPDFCVALNMLASAETFMGNRLAARTASLKAIAAAGRAIRPADPTVDSLANSISNDILSEAIKEPPPQPRKCVRWRKEAALDPELAAVLRDLRQRLDRSQAMLPFHIHHEEVLFNLNFQLAALEWIRQLDGQPSEAARASLATGDGALMLSQIWRPSGLHAMLAPGGFPHTLRSVEAVSIRIAQATGAAIAASGRLVSQPSYCYVEWIPVSSSGLRWVRGWAYDPANPGQTVFALIENGRVLSGGLTYLRRPEIVSTLKDPRAIMAGFAFPVPVDASDEFGELQSMMMSARRHRVPFWRR